MPTEDQLYSSFSMSNANATMIREVLQFLVEEGHMEGSTAARIVLGSANENFAPENSSGPMFDLGREYLVKLAQAFLSFPSYPESAGGERWPH